jgi:hypothetical protein
MGCFDDATGGMTGSVCGSGDDNYAGGNSDSVCGDNGLQNQIFGSTVHQYPANDIRWYDPLGPNSSGQFSYNNGGPDMRSSIYSKMNSYDPLISKATNETAKTAFGAASDPGYTQAKQLARSTIGGTYLDGSPELENQIAQMRTSANREVANTNAGVRDQFARNGLQFSTANQQAQEANQAYGTAKANETEANTRLSNYQTERGRQYDALNTLDTANSAPLTYLSQVSSSALSPLYTQAQTVNGLSGGGQMASQNYDNVDRSGYLRSMGTTISSF